MQAPQRLGDMLAALTGRSSEARPNSDTATKTDSANPGAALSSLRADPCHVCQRPEAISVHRRGQYELYGECCGCRSDLCVRVVFGQLSPEKTEAESRADELRKRAEQTCLVDPSNQAARRALAKVIREAKDGTSALLVGPVGTGKTHLSLTAALSLALDGVNVRWVDETTWLRAWRAKADPETKPWGDALSLACDSADVLVIDDLGREAGITSTASAAIEALFDVRYTTQRTTIVTTNLRLRPAQGGPPSLLETRGERTLSRLVGLTKGNIVEVLGTDRRRAWGKAA